MMSVNRVIFDDASQLSLGHPYFFDTNIVFYVHGPFANQNDWRTRVYAKLMAGILREKGKIYIDAVVVCEFINLYIRVLHQDLIGRRLATPDKKEFRQTASFDDIARAAGRDLAGFCRSAELLDSSIARTEIETYVQDLRAGTMDFNDLVIVQACRRHGLTLVTHDADFDGVDVPLVTANKSFSD